MAKKDKKGDGAVQNREIFQRMNFLYQAAMCMATLTTTQQKSNPNQTNNNNNNNNNTSVSNATKSITDDKENDDHANTTKNGDIENSTMDIVDNKDNEMKDISGTNLESIVEIPSSTTSPQGKLSRRKKRELLRRRKNRIAMEQISDNRLHHNLKNTNRSTDLYQLSGTARFYASTLREVGRKSVIRIDPVIKRSICQRCEALLIPSISCEVRIEASPQLHTLVTCTACGAFRRFYCMAGKGIEQSCETELETAATEITDDLLNQAET